MGNSRLHAEYGHGEEKHRNIFRIELRGPEKIFAERDLGDGRHEACEPEPFDGLCGRESNGYQSL